MRFQTQEELTRIKNRLARWFSIYFPEYKDVYGKLDAVSGIIVLKEAPLPVDIVKLGVEGVNKMWRDIKLRGAGLKRAKTLVNEAEHSVGSKEAPEAARMELRILLEDYDSYSARMDELLNKLEEKLKEIPYIDKLLEIKWTERENVCRKVPLQEAGSVKRKTKNEPVVGRNIFHRAQTLSRS